MTVEEIKNDKNTIWAVAIKSEEEYKTLAMYFNLCPYFGLATYSLNKFGGNTWTRSSEYSITDGLTLIDFKDIEFEWQPKWGEEVEVRDDDQGDDEDWYKGFFVGKMPNAVREYELKYVVVQEDAIPTAWQHIRKPKKSTTLELTIEEIAVKFGVKEVKIVDNK